ncbi:hypothetical protein [Hydrogenophaga sp. OTU3427]|uniref:hypothetical protein n=1 Tax=Hydrogenophaga sp. OTU3427 TaxID=3043856 RepID=UPI00313D3914
MNKHMRKRSVGFVLIEALVALVVVAVGVLGIGKLSALLLRGTGESKTRAEALQVAQDRVEKARDFQLGTGTGTGCGSLSNDTGTAVTGVNANYTVSSTFTTIAGADARAMEVCVTWDGGSCTGSTNRIILRTSVTCEGMGTSAQVGKGGASSALGGFIKTPTGRGKVGGGSQVTGGSTNYIPGTSIADGTKTAAANGTRYITDASGNVLLTMAKLDCETDVPEFSTISGTVFVEAKNGSAIASASDLKVLSSDASYCAVVPYDNSRVMPSGASGNSIKYFYTYYQCYVGAEWWGNIGLVRLDNANANNRVCQGSPANSNINTIFSKHPQINSSRGYRGYRDLGNGIYESKGVGEQETASTQCPTRKAYIPQFLRNHHFVHSVITGSVSDSACSSVETDLKALTPSGLLDSGSGAPTVTDVGVGKAVTANTNPGKFYCMSNADGVTCPDLINTVTPPSTLLQGTITADVGVDVTGIDPSELGTTCSTVTFGPRVGNTYSYSCQILWTGFIGSSWNGLISFVLPTGTLCSSGSSYTSTPTGSTVSYAILDKLAPTTVGVSAPNSIRFTDIPSTVTGVTLNFQAKSTCPTALGQVNLQWTAGSTSTTLTWAAVSGATSYEYLTCSTTGNNALTACTPTGTPTSLGNVLTYSLSSNPGNKETVCVSVRAAASGSTGDYMTKCVYRSGGSWSRT